MCGIAGIYGIEQMADAKDRVARMTSALAHRGPDAEGFFDDSVVALGHRRLSVIDVDPASNQPFVSKGKKFAMVFNGEVYNYRQLRTELQTTFEFETRSDTEVIFKALQLWGADALKRFNGMFALAFWNAEQETMLLARDRVGIKPLYYAQTGQSVVFASELRSILASKLVDPKLNSAHIHEYLAYQTVHSPYTLVEGIMQLEAGHYAQLSDGEWKSTRYWKPWQKGRVEGSKEDVLAEVKSTFTAAVEKRLVADVPLGAFLSGGIDSSLVVATMSKLMDRPVDTFNVSFDESDFSEAQYAKQVADKYRCNHHEILLKPTSFLEALPQALAAVDHPSGDGPNTFIVSRETKKLGETVALSGLGGDELFAGYDLFKRIPEVAEKEWLLSFPKFIRQAAGNLLVLAKPGMASAKTSHLLTQDYFNLEHLYPIFRRVLLDAQIRDLLSDNSPKVDVVKAIIARFQSDPAFASMPVLSKIGMAEMSTYMQHVLLRDTDQMSMAHALEVRVPFLDHELIELSMGIGDELKYPNSPKQLLTEAFASELPDDIVHRKKMGFVLPWEQWMRHELKDFCEERLNRLGQSGYFSESAIVRLWQAFLNGDKKVSWSRIWPLVALSDWMQRNDVQ